ncbi:hypothetical protein [Bradyrhizobium neotropicale]|uniref:Uncharacterized protein n=1 Tax=Bradyrhizobium neotropicale TaxID=1497615 RepID=A0A176YVI0_9BRAD|nr:hypothetical protein [Bradyrhizobium neotropicale]OAF11698.1 hypothetical protein AXW67_21770 [Bradyrhizobium neotropicale]
MIYSPNSAIDAQLLTQSRELVHKALKLLRNSDHLVSGLRLRDELSREIPRGEGDRSDMTPDLRLTAN